MSPLLQERATPAAAQPLQPLPLGEEQQQQQLEREDSDSVSSSDSYEVHVMSVCSGLGCPAIFPLLYCAWEGAGFPRLCVLCLWWWEWPKLGALQCVVCTVADLLKLLP